MRPWTFISGEKWRKSWPSLIAVCNEYAPSDGRAPPKNGGNPGRLAPSSLIAVCNKFPATDGANYVASMGLLSPASLPGHDEPSAFRDRLYPVHADLDRAKKPRERRRLAIAGTAAVIQLV